MDLVKVKVKSWVGQRRGEACQPGAHPWMHASRRQEPFGPEAEMQVHQEGSPHVHHQHLRSKCKAGLVSGEEFAGIGPRWCPRRSTPTGSRSLAARLRKTSWVCELWRSPGGAILVQRSNCKFTKKQTHVHHQQLRPSLGLSIHCSMVKKRRKAMLVMWKLMMTI